ncbi:arsenate reductase [Nonlabens ulvanivorans]|nr:protein-tyrosine-phosphatase [Nonlabens ulvanivorans]GAK88171.1 arsenate reductase [Nonlabens ulvanivorans]
MYTAITELLNQLDVDSIPLSRKRDLNQLSTYINQSLKKYKKAQLTFICTHNSRRSHLCQIWAQVAARHFDIPDVYCYSGGTETTAVYPMIIKTIKKQGFTVTKSKPKDNPKYYIEYSEVMPPITAFSKIFDDESNPTLQFGAVMTCDHASENCPFVPGAEKRFGITYLDPKVSDDTPEQKEVYKERSLQIATEMKYVFSQVQSN